MPEQNNGAPQALSENIVTQNVGDELLIYNLETHRAMSLNPTVACVWEACNGVNSFSEIRRQAESRLKLPLPEEAVILALDELSKNKLLIETGSDVKNENLLSDMSRRAMIRRVGLATAVAIPVIMAISAPHAAQAASGSTKLPDRSRCRVGTDCQSNCCFAGICVPEDNCF